MRKALGKVKQAFSSDKSNTPLAPFGINMDVEDVFLHGRLDVQIKEARNVQGRKTSLFKKMERCLTSSLDGIDPYCTVKLAYNSYMRSDIIDNTNDPVWNLHGSFDIAHELDNLEIRVKAAKRSGLLGIISKVTHLSMLSISAAELERKRRVSGWFHLTNYRSEITAEMPHDDSSSDSSDDDDEREYQPGDLGEIYINVSYTPIAEYISRDKFGQIGLAESYYPVRQGVHLSMYQDADVPPGTLPEIPFRPGFTHGRCWVDVCNAIMNATELIYITGWAVWPELKMIRTHHEDEQYHDLTLGEMLKMKAEEGVTVCVMVWDEVASNAFYKGLMGTHDEEVVKYFKGSGVNAIKVSRQNDKSGPFSDLNDSLMFTHHQKTIICGRYDGDMDKHRLQAFVGGLDLTDGRYDNPQHALFRTIQGIHAPPDFWQACSLTVTAPAGPREPWHDIHSRATGEAAWDVLDNFEARWGRQASRSYRDKLYQPGPNIMMRESEAEIADGPWNVQILRSINESSAEFMLDRPGLYKRCRALVDASIHDAYIHAIRRAKSFIFLENQYFLGSSHVWSRASNQRGGFSPHLIAIELAEKIVAKIRAGQRFTVYLIVPMHPEGPPESGAVQEILAHQRKTVNVITSRIKQALIETESDTEVSDWFAMFCLVNRESEEGGKGNGGVNEKEKLLAATRRFMIYVHSKFAIFDDEAAIIGSANINSRSMDGSRDSEICTFSWQPEHVAEGPTAYGDDVEGDVTTPSGDVAAFRSAVWSEHVGAYHEEFENPGSLECVRKLKELGHENWLAYADDSEVNDLPNGHLALYPYSYNEETGEVIDSNEVFPDCPGAKICGSSSVAMPNNLTG